MTYLIPLDIQQTIHFFMNYKHVPDKQSTKENIFFFFLHKNLPEIAMSLQKLTATGSIDNLIIWLWK